MGSGLIVHNNLYNAMLQSSDGGAMYSYNQDGRAFYYTANPGPDTVIAYNCVHDIFRIAPLWYGVGIYLDWGSNHYVVDHNLVYNVPVSLSLDLTNTGILLYNNTLAGQRGSRARIEP